MELGAFPPALHSRCGLFCSDKVHSHRNRRDAVGEPVLEVGKWSEARESHVDRAQGWETGGGQNRHRRASLGRLALCLQSARLTWETSRRVSG